MTSQTAALEDRAAPSPARRLRALVPVTALLFVLACPALALTTEEARSLVEEANGLFRQANELSARDPNAAVELYQRAALRYERIARDGQIRNGKLFYNLGNIYFRAEDIGRAILNYRRAELYMPGDANLHRNLDYARRRRQDRFEEKQETRVLRTLLFWHFDFPVSVRLVLLTVLSGVFWSLLTLRTLLPKRAPRAALVIVGLTAALLCASAVADAAGLGRRVAGVILAPEVVARKGDAESYEPSFTEPLHAGAEFELLEDRNGWYRIELRDGRECWIPRQSAALVEAPPSRE